MTKNSFVAKVTFKIPVTYSCSSLGVLYLISFVSYFVVFPSFFQLLKNLVSDFSYFLLPFALNILLKNCDKKIPPDLWLKNTITFIVAFLLIGLSVKISVILLKVNIAKLTMILKFSGWFIINSFPFENGKFFTPFFYKQSIFDPRPENCLSFCKKSPPKIV